VNGQSLFDFEAGRWSVNHTAKWLGDRLGKLIKPNKLGYLIKIGELRASKCGRILVVKREDAEALYKKLRSGHYATGCAGQHNQETA
jgi:hypothetical protein